MLYCYVTCRLKINLILSLSLSYLIFIISYLILSYLNLSYLILSYLILSYLSDRGRDAKYACRLNLKLAKLK